MKIHPDHLHHCPEDFPCEERMMNTAEPLSETNALVSWGWTHAETDLANASRPTASRSRNGLFSHIDLLKPLRDWLDSIQFSNPKLAHRVCHLVPAQCPFERTVTLFGRAIFRIPPLCKLNPLYEEVVALRFRALCYLADECGEDISRYC
jgi:hypothetical protein